MGATLVQKGAGSGNTSATQSSYTYTFPSPSTAGKLLVVMMSAVGGGADSFTTPTGWTRVALVQNTAGSYSYGALYIYPNNPGGITSFRAQAGIAEWAFSLGFMEWDGILLSGALDVSGTATSTVTSTSVAASTSASTANAQELIIMGVGIDAAYNGSAETITTTSTGFTQQLSQQDTTLWSAVGMASRVTTSAAVQSCTESWNHAGPGVGIIAAFKLAPVGTTVTVAAGAKTALSATLPRTVGARVAIRGVGLTLAAGADISLADGGTGQGTGGNPADAGASIALRLSGATRAAGATASIFPHLWRDAGARIALITPQTRDAGAALALQVYTPPTPTGFTVIHAGQDITSYVDELSFSGSSVLGQGAGVGGGGVGNTTSCSFEVYLGPAAKAIGAGQTPTGTSLVRQGEVLVYDYRGSLIFGGHAVTLDDASDSLTVRTTVSCVDYWQHLDRQQVNEKFFNTNDVAIIKSLLTTYAPWIDQSLLPATGTFTYDQRAFKMSLREAIQKITDDTGYMVWVDAQKRIHYIPPTSAASAPFTLSDDPNSVTSFGHALTKYSVDDTGLINRVTFYGGKNTSADFTQDLSVQANGTNTTFFVAYFPHKAADGAFHLVKNSVELALGSVFDTSDSGKFKSDGGTSDALINLDSKIIMFDVAPAATDTLTFTYRYQKPLVIILSSQSSYNFYGDWYDGRITDMNTFSASVALQRCRVLLAQQAFGLVSLAATTWTPGLAAGQLLRITNTLRGVDESFLIQKVTTKPLGGGQFEYSLDLGAWNWNLLDLLVQNARILNQADTATEEDISIIQAKETTTAGTVTIAITKSTNPSGLYYAGQPTTLSGFFTVTG